MYNVCLIASQDPTGVAAAGIGVKEVHSRSRRALLHLHGDTYNNDVSYR